MICVPVVAERNIKSVTGNKNMENCVFCKKIKGDLEVQKIYEDESVLVFIPRDQICKGHILVVPKEHYENIFDIPTEILNRIMETTQKLSKKCISEPSITGVNILHASGKDAQQSVFHFHLHVVPRCPDDGLDLWFKAKIEKEQRV